MPDSLASDLNRRSNIGLMFVHSLAYYRRVLRGIWRYAEARPQWQLTSLAPEQQTWPIADGLGLDGLIAAVNTQWLHQALRSWDRPAVNVSAVLPAQRFPRVGVDNAQVGRLAAGHFLERGLRHFAFVGPPQQLFSVERQAAYCQCVQEAGYSAACYPCAGHREFDPLGHRWDLEPEVEAWLRELPKPVGIFTPNDLWGVQVVLACRSAAVRVPEDVAVLGVDDDDLYCELTRPRLSSIIVPAEQIGYQAVAILEGLLAGRAAPDGPLLLPPVGVTARRSSEVLAVDDPQVVAAIRFIREHVHQQLQVADVLEHVSLGRRTLERRFRRALGWGLAEEIRRTRLERARRLLAGTDLSIQAIAVQAGFFDYRRLAAAIRQHFGVSPSDYRRQLRGPGSASFPG